MRDLHPGSLISSPPDLKLDETDGIAPTDLAAHGSLLSISPPRGRISPLEAQAHSRGHDRITIPSRNGLRREEYPPVDRAVIQPYEGSNTVNIYRYTKLIYINL